jgi:tRNA-specific 2-thiouridylase
MNPSAPTLVAQRLKILVAMSGGVDSSYVAAALAQQGHDVTGVTLRVWQDKNAAFSKSGPGGADACNLTLVDQAPPGGKPSKSCCGAEDMRDARSVAQAQGIPYYVLDYEDRFRQDVIDPFVAEYLAGRTPNPCVACNDKVKFGPLLQAALGLGVDKLATGHYARLAQDPDGRVRLFRAKDRLKDQTYFLYRLTQPQLLRLSFPLGELEKDQVRKGSQELGLVTAAKRESMDICFVPKGDYGAVLKAYAPQSLRPGPVVDQDGKELGTHEGLAFHTVGQRRGLGISAAEPLYVLRLDRSRNAVVVGPESGLMRRDAVARDASFTSQPLLTPSAPFRCSVKIRSSHPGAPALLSPRGDGRWQITFDDAQRAVTPGQAAVFYDHDECIGGAILDELEA